MDPEHLPFPLPIMQDTRVRWSRKAVRVKLPQEFPARYLGSRKVPEPFGYRPAKNAVDDIVSCCQRRAEADEGYTARLHKVRVAVDEEGVWVWGLLGRSVPAKFPVQSLGYGMQDSVHNRVFALIQRLPSGPQCFCHIFLCPSGSIAFALTRALAGAFEVLRLNHIGSRDDAGRTRSGSEIETHSKISTTI